MYKRAALCLLLMICLAVGLTLPCAAATQQSSAFFDLPAEYGQMLQELPAALRESLPEGLFSTDAAE